ncbi:MAG: hypothetical protein LBI68_04735 [Azoarcus sp.]|nr:hypothetical protein [Azoarcus sp.]
MTIMNMRNMYKKQQFVSRKRLTRRVSPHQPICAVIPAQAGIQNSTHVARFLDSRLRGNDGGFIGPGNTIGLNCGF